MAVRTAVILAGGPGKRLECFDTIKPLIKVGGKPLIVWTIERLQEAGILDIKIVVNPGDTLVQRALLGDARIHATVEYIDQPITRPTMLGSVLALEGKIQGPFLLTVCDVLSARNTYTLFQKVGSREMISIGVSMEQAAYTLSGATIFAQCQKGRVLQMGAHIPEANAMEMGIYAFGEGALSLFVKKAKRLPPQASFEEALACYAKQMPLVAVACPGTWFDINTPSVLIRAELFLQQGDSRAAKKQSVKRLARLSAPISFRFQKLLAFDVFVKRGLLKNIGRYEVIPPESYYAPHHLIVDKNIDALYGKSLHKQLLALGYHVNKIVVDPGEWTKSADVYLRLAQQILADGIDKKSIIISLGGGVIKDLAGFLAATLYRGIGSIHIPTTVLSQCDAAIALKQGVNGEGGKNLIGSFYAPLKVLVDPDVLTTLDARYVSDGLAEILKQAFAQDAKLYQTFVSYRGPLKHIPFLEKVIRWSIRLKIASIQKDYYEDHVALVYQYGHEIGHAIEFLSGYQLGHGESVAIGMRVSAELSRLMGIADDAVVQKHIDLMKKYRLPVEVPVSIRAEDVMNMLKSNKKFHSGEAHFVLVKAIGSLWNQRGRYTATCSDVLVKKAIQLSYAPGS